MNLVDSHDTPRFVTMARGDRSALRLAALLQMTLPGAPCVYYGDEVGMEGGADPDNRRAYPREAAPRDVGLRAFYRDAIAVRRTQPSLRALGLRLLFAQAGTLAYLRSGGGDPVVVALVADRIEATLHLALPELAGRRLSVRPLAGWSSEGELDVPPDGHMSLTVPAREGVVLGLSRS
jgi:neopullulanase